MKLLDDIRTPPKTILTHPAHPSPHVIFMQPLRPTCWNCDRVPTTHMLLQFPLTVFVQGLCDEHAKTLAGRLKRRGFELSTEKGRSMWVNTPLLAALANQKLDGTLQASDLVLPALFPRDWHLHVGCVQLPPLTNKICWSRKCDEKSTVSIARFSFPKIVGHLVDTTTVVPAPQLNGICRTYADGVGGLLCEHDYSMHPQPSGGMIYRSPLCPIPFGSDPDDDGGDEDEKDVAA